MAWYLISGGLVWEKHLASSKPFIVHENKDSQAKKGAELYWHEETDDWADVGDSYNAGNDTVTKKSSKTPTEISMPTKDETAIAVDEIISILTTAPGITVSTKLLEYKNKIKE